MLGSTLSEEWVSLGTGTESWLSNALLLLEPQLSITPKSNCHIAALVWYYCRRYKSLISWFGKFTYIALTSVPCSLYGTKDLIGNQHVQERVGYQRNRGWRRRHSKERNSWHNEIRLYEQHEGAGTLCAVPSKLHVYNSATIQPGSFEGGVFQGKNQFAWCD